MTPYSRTALSLLLVVLAGSIPAAAFQPRPEGVRFDALAIADPGEVLAVRAVDTGSLPPGDRLRQGWERFARQEGGAWRSYVDERSGLPTLVQGSGIAWAPGPGNPLPSSAPPTLEQLEALARAFLERHALLLGDWRGQLELDRDASGGVEDRVFYLSFRQVVNGVPVVGARYEFQLVQGNLVAFGATRWSAVRRPTFAALGVDEARARLLAYLGHPDDVVELATPSLQLVPVDPRGDGAAAWTGPRGEGYAHQLVWRFVFAVSGEAPTWVAHVDADNGRIAALYDDTRYARIKGGVFPLSNDGECPLGCQQGGFPMPYSDYVTGGNTRQTGDFGLYTCSGTASLSLSGPYVRINDNCGAVSESASCGTDFDLGASEGSDCTVPDGRSPGNTAAARTAFYSINRLRQKIRSWLPDNAWAQGQVQVNVNINNSCNAFWNGTVNMYRSGGNCRNTGELQGVLDHETGHGFDQNDGGGYDNPSEAYADVVAVFQSRESCVGRGFFVSGNCSGYGDTCLDCSGIRDVDWNKRVRHTPATPAGFLTTSCSGGGGPCGKEVHCEGYVGAETLFDLATRDLPAAGLDRDSAWQLAERLWYVSRKNAGGNAYNCALPSADGCGTGTWFHRIRVADDNDGNLANGTPHAAAIYAAFARHGIACGAADDPSNLDSPGCLSLFRPTIIEVARLGDANRISWSSVPGASKYTILRSDLGCDRAHTIVGEAGALAGSFTDDQIDSDFPVTYRIQASASNGACLSPVSDCEVQSGPLVGYVAEAGRGLLSIVGLTTGGVGPVAPGLSLPQGVSVRRDLAFAYVTEQGSGELSRVALPGGATTTIASGLSAPRGTPRLDLDESYAYVTETTSGELSRVRLADGTTSRIASGLSSPFDVELSPGGRTAYVTENAAGRLVRVDLATGAVTPVASGLSSPRFVKLDARETRAFVTEAGSGELSSVDLITGEVRTIAAGLATPAGIELNCFESNAFVVEETSGKIASVSLASGDVARFVSALSSPAGLAMRRDDATVRTIPYEVRNLRFSTASTLAWDSMAPYAGSATTYDLIYGDLGDVADLAGGGGQQCLADGIEGTETADLSPRPAPGHGWFYLVRGVNRCGAGRYETATGGGDRISVVCD